jgi:hypothetical protein
LGFETHIKPMFREGDRQSMQFASDLWSHDDAGKRACAIVARLNDVAR